ncbi:isoaspartyl peptidase/L-asparaginase family protein [Providencia vermicola]|uniref:Isoaspartyl peptidase n=1 Tax=Providencia vermicola TaxID=333965 RepID=A0AAX3S3Q8_9GAMM|nr:MULTISPECIES: isoaspartyl peptidase/L-asparaginase [Providencia]ELX8379860.1 isoaspartyl peptidase/L-asparaginase [Providencia stuartii]EMD5259250.1 isoaspartyl peptidase/L-asparaginase [Providencia stuartii]USB38271.1 isoaspartyl peptidase/L-asparaginase [Providencia vermicola]WFC07206.1 isoaspartyl peptidase/L-asparaginase [Providencia vermicola]
MKKLNLFKYISGSILLSAILLAFPSSAQKNNFRLVIHGGAGDITEQHITIEQKKAHEEKLTEALQAGYGILAQGGDSVDAVQAAVIVMEDSPLYNAGKGASLTTDNKVELDASIMDGRTRKAGAVAGVSNVKNPIMAAYKVMTKTPYVMMGGVGAEQFAKSEGLDIVDPTYFMTEQRVEQLNKVKEISRKIDHEKGANAALFVDPLMYDYKYGTVGAVAIDTRGNLASATSTGGSTNKHYGRIGDSPIIGAGTYADNKTIAISTTGLGEVFMRSVAAYDVAAQIQYQGLPLSEAGMNTLNTVRNLGGTGGLIAIDKNGNFIMQFNTKGMFRGTIAEDGIPQVAIFNSNSH